MFWAVVPWKSGYETGQKLWMCNLKLMDFNI